MPSFRKSMGYIRMLAELDLLKDIPKIEFEDERTDDDCTGDPLLYSFDATDKEDRIDNDCTPKNNQQLSGPLTLTASINQKGTAFRIISLVYCYSYYVQGLSRIGSHHMQFML